MRSLTRDEACKALLTAVCAVCFLTGKVCFGGNDDAVWKHFVYCFFHANVFHLLANVMCLWLIRARVRVIPSVLIGIGCSFLPCPVWSWSELGFVSLPSCGLSGVLMAVVGMSWGEALVRSDKRRWCVLALKWVALPLVVSGLLPNMNLFIHVWCWLFGVAYIPIRKQIICCSTRSHRRKRRTR